MEKLQPHIDVPPYILEIAALEQRVQDAEEQGARLVREYERMKTSLEEQLDMLRTKRDNAEAERDALRGMMRYALDGPDDADCLKTILRDALDGCTGAADVHEIRGEREILCAERDAKKARVEALEGALLGWQTWYEGRSEGFRSRCSKKSYEQGKAALRGKEASDE